MGSSVRVRHHRLGVVIGERIIVTGFDDPFRRLGWSAGREDTHALFPQAEMPQDALDHRPVINERIEGETAVPAKARRDKTECVGACTQ